jgi:sulfonate transport system ATP-binding protein
MHALLRADWPEHLAYDPFSGMPLELLRELQDILAPPAAESVAPALPGLALSIDNLSKRFGSNHVLRGVDLHVPAGQFVAIVGKSGCGKSTLLRLVVGLDEASAGRLWLGDDPHRPSSEPRRIMFQEPRLLPWARVIDNVAVGLGPGVAGSEREARAQAALDRVGLAEKARDWPATLSGGQRQRVALARALVSRPRFLALDEPLGALDALTRIDMQSLIESVWRAEGFTALLVTHDVGEAVALADRILVIDEGAIALDLAVDAPRPRRRGNAALAALEGQILGHLFRDRTPADAIRAAA